jgi:hypothetical protein
MRLERVVGYSLRNASIDASSMTPHAEWDAQNISSDRLQKADFFIGRLLSNLQFTPRPPCRAVLAP